MIWLGLLFGISLGIALDSFPSGVFFTILCAVIGFIFNDSYAKKIRLIAGLQKRLDDLQRQNTTHSTHIATIERRLEEALQQIGQIERQNTAPTAAPVAENLQSEVSPAAPASAVPVEAIAPVVVPAVAPTVAPVVPPVMASAIAEDKLSVTVPVTPEVSDTQEAISSPLVPAAAVPPEVPPAPVIQPVRPISRPLPSPGMPRVQLPPAPTIPPALEEFIQRWVIGGNPLVKIGVLILFLGLAFLLRYASEYVVVPVELRYAGVAATGVALLVFGWRLRDKKDNYGLILQGAGIATMYLTPLAAMRLSNLLPPELGFGILLAVAVFASILAILQDSLPMAMVATLGGFAAPVLVSTRHDSHLALFLFLTLLNLGIAAIAWFKAWRVLNLIGFGGTLTLSLGWAMKFYRPELFAVCETFLLLFFVLYVFIAFLFARRVLEQADSKGAIDTAAEFGAQIRQAANRLNYVDGTLVFGVPFVAFAMQYMLMQPYANGAAFSALGFGLFYAALALLLFRQSGTRYLLLMETLLALGVIFGTLAIPLGLDQVWTSAAWAVEAAGMYWVGIRQQRLHGRAFSLLILLVAALAFLNTLHINDEAATAALSGSTLGCLLLGGSAAWIVWLQRIRADITHETEQILRPSILILGSVFFAITPFTLLGMQWASPVLAVMGVLALYLAVRLSENLLQIVSCAYQGLAGLLFATTLRLTSGGAALMHGVAGLFTVSLIGACMLASAWLFLRQRAATKREAQGAAAPSFGTMVGIGILLGIVFINLAPLFVLPWRYAALVWPLSGLLTLWWAVRIRYLLAIILALVLQVVAGLTHIVASVLTTGIIVPADAHLKPFLHSGFLGPILISLAAFFCARMLHKASATGQQDTTKVPVISLGGIALLWSVTWWSFGWVNEIDRVAAPQMFAVYLIALTIATGCIWQALAQRWQWRELGWMTLLYLPALILIALDCWGSDDIHPLHGWAMLAWPLALLMHGFLLRRQTAWINPAGRVARLTHVVGAWFFVIQAALELRWRFAGLGDEHSAWPLLGWMIAPVAYLLLLTRPRIQQAWPVREQRDSYLLVSAMPVMLYLLAWLWMTNLISPGNAAPLPYLPLVNPLEIAHAGVLLGAFLWFWPLRTHPALRGNVQVFIGIIMATGLAMITGIVARSCHHLGDVAWDMDAMLDSRLFQTALSIVWSLVAISAMLIGNRHLQRRIWITGAGLMGVVVAKLFLVELSDKGSLARIVSFIVVGLLLLVVGYFAPLPPRQTAAQNNNENEAIS